MLLPKNIRLSQPKRNTAGTPIRLSASAVSKGRPEASATTSDVVRDHYAAAVKASAALGASLAVAKKGSTAAGFSKLLSSVGIKATEAQTYINFAAASAKPTARRALKSDNSNALYGKV